MSMKELYKTEVAPALMKKFAYKSPMQIPKIEKVVVNVGCGDARDNPKTLEAVMRDITTITGQKAVVTKAKKSVANFKVREGMPVGCRVTLRRELMWDFVDKLINFALPRVRDFRGVPDRGFDGRGNFTMGIKDHTIFPEINMDKVELVKGMNVTVTTSANTDKEGKLLLELLGMPFKK